MGAAQDTGFDLAAVEACLGELATLVGEGVVVLRPPARSQQEQSGSLL